MDRFLRLAATTVCLAALAGRSAAQTVLQRWDEQFGYFGFVSRAAGDVDGDGHGDVIVGQSFWGNPYVPGEAHVFSGADGAPLLHFADAPIGAGFGFSVAGIGDVDGDGVPDLLVGAPNEDLGAGPGSGSVRVYSGVDGAVIHVVGGLAVNERFGSAAAACRDVDGDGVGDFVVSAPALGNLGRVRVYSGASAALLFELVGSTPDDGFGTAVDGAGDVDGDGRGDVVVGAPLDSSAGSNAGRVLVVSGLGFALYELRGAAEEALGYSVAGVGDVDGDGFDDVLAGAPGTAAAQLPATGLARLYSGSDGRRLLDLSAESDEYDFGRTVGGPGDVDGDGVPDLIAGSVRRARVHSGADGSLLLRVFPHVDIAVFSVGGAGDLDADGLGDVLLSGHGICPPPSNGCGGHVLAVSGVPRQRATRTCFGDGSGAACPCGNTGETERGCAGSATPGARMHVEGSTSVSADDLVLLLLYGRPAELGVLFAGGPSATPPAAFGDGLRCAATPLVRIGTTESAGYGVWGAGLSAQFGWSPGDRRVVQAWYRDPNGPCGSGSNVSSGVDVYFTP